MPLKNAPKANSNWPPHITVAVVIEKDNKYLMVEEVDQNDPTSAPVLNQPAGHLEAGESVFVAAVRETLEETAWQIKLQHIIGIYHYYSSANDITYHRICFLGDPLNQTDAELDADIMAATWMSFDEIRLANLRSPLVISCIEDHLSGQQVPLSFLKHFNLGEALD